MHKLGKNKLRACQMKKRRTDNPPRRLKGFAMRRFELRSIGSGCVFISLCRATPDPCWLLVGIFGLLVPAGGGIDFQYFLVLILPIWLRI
jgi:hypothetical protein